MITGLKVWWGISMNFRFKDFLIRVAVIFLVLSVPLMLFLYAMQAKQYTNLTKEVRALEQKQEKLIEDNKKLVSDIAILSSADRIEKMAVEELGMHKAEKEDIVRVEMTGEKQ